MLHSLLHFLKNDINSPSVLQILGFYSYILTATLYYTWHDVTAVWQLIVKEVREALLCAAGGKTFYCICAQSTSVRKFITERRSKTEVCSSKSQSSSVSKGRL